MAFPNCHEMPMSDPASPAPSDQVVSELVALLQWLCGEAPALTQIAGHEDLDRDEVDASDDPAMKVRRKRDPGPLFPWAEVLGVVPLLRVA
jgi:N-acetylmuramoyl-L-alanine amidase